MEQDNLTTLINQARAGDDAAVGRLFEVLYPQLRQLARAQLRGGRASGALNTTSLVHESFLKLAGAQRVGVQDKSHFLRYAARVMRSVIVDIVRAQQAERRGGGERPVTLHTALIDTDNNATDILQVHDALEKLRAIDERMVEVVELRYFAGLTELETAEALEITDRTVRRIWQRARLWLAEALSNTPSTPGS